MTAAGWERVRAIRIAALRDTPDAFGTTVDEEEVRAPESWQERLESSGATTFLATHDGADVGIVVGAPVRGRDNVAGLYAMWVPPAARGTGVSDLLVAAVVEWARDLGFTRLLLDVADDNPTAIRLYERNGFMPTGVTGMLPPPREHVLEHERALDL